MIEAVLEGRPRDLGGFHVRRMLPTVPRRAVGPFVFFDHFGPAVLPSGTGMDVRPHPHVNLATVTYLFDGEIVHRDTLGFEQPIRPGAVNWMSAGRGIAHSERSSPEERKRGPSLHGLQCWVGLPTDQEESEPTFAHHAAETLPALERSGARLRVVAGDAYGLRAPVKVLSPLFYVEAKLEPGAHLALPDEHADRAAYVIDGTVGCDGAEIGAGKMIVFRPGAATLEARGPAHVMLLGGAPLDGERHLWWNFVSSRPARIEQAKRDWAEDRFGPVIHDTEERIPLPSDEAMRRL